METEGLKVITGPEVGLTGVKLATVALEEQALQASVHVVIELPKLDSGIAGAKVRAPAPEHRIELRDGLAQVPMTHGAGRECFHTLSNPLHGPLRRPSLEVVHPSVSLLPNASAHVLAQVTAKKIEARPSSREVDASRLLRMQLQTQPREHLLDALLGLLARRLRVAHDHESSSGGELHPSALREPDVKLSPHPAPIAQPRP